MLAFPDRELLFFADTTVNIDPDAETLRDIALQTAAFVRELGIRPRVAMVSFSNFGSASHDESTRMSDAVDLVRAADPDLEIDGEMQADTAVDAIKLRDTYPFTHLQDPANVLIFTRLSAANAAYKLLDCLGGGRRHWSGTAGNGQARTHSSARLLGPGSGESGYGRLGRLAGQNEADLARLPRTNVVRGVRFWERNSTGE